MAGQERAQPGDRVGVQVVGRLVEQQRGRAGRPAAPAVGGGEQDAGQLDPAALAAGQGGDLLVQHPVGQAEVGADPGRLALRRVAAERGEPLLDPPVVAHRLLVLRAVDQLGHRGLRLLHPAQHLVEAARGQHPVLRGDQQVALARVLRQVARPGVFAPTEPAYGSLSPASTRIEVVLPAPLRPTSPIRSPCCTRRVAPDSRMRDPARSSRSVAVIKEELQEGSGSGRRQAPRRPYPIRITEPRVPARAERISRSRVAPMTRSHRPGRPRHRGQPRHRLRHRRRAALPRRVGDDHRPQAGRAGRGGRRAGRRGGGRRPRPGARAARQRRLGGVPGGGRAADRRDVRQPGDPGQQHRGQPDLRAADGRRPGRRAEDLRDQRGGRARLRAAGLPGLDGRARRRGGEPGLGGRAALDRGDRRLRGVQGGADPAHRGAGLAARAGDPGERGGAGGGQDAASPRRCTPRARRRSARPTR